MQWIVVRYLKNGKEVTSQPMFADEAQKRYEEWTKFFPKARIAIRKAA